MADYLTLAMFVALCAGYLLGSISFGLVAARLFGLGDLRKVGSGNIGATNVLRTGNKVAAVFTLIGDSGKGAAAVLIMRAIAERTGNTGLEIPAAFGAFLGHCYPVWLGFRGGKGVATFIGTVLALQFWIPGVAVCGAWLAGAAISRISSVGAFVASASAPVLMWLAGRPDYAALCFLLALLVWIKHHANLGRLLRGEEPRIGAKKKDA